jgi:IS30 family transposase
VGNADARVRRWPSCDIRIDALPDGAITVICRRMNATPRECLGYATPAEAPVAKMERITGWDAVATQVDR